MRYNLDIHFPLSFNEEFVAPCVCGHDRGEDWKIA